jgi:F5/8 type C domain/Peptidase family M23
MLKYFFCAAVPLMLYAVSPAQNIAQHKLCSSSSANGTQSCSKAIDGTVSEPSKWVSNGSTRESWLSVNLLDVYNISSVVVRHAGAAGENTQFNTKEYRIEVSGSAGGPWSVIKTVNNSSLQSVVSTPVSAQAKFIRLYIVQPNNGLDNYARIAEFEVYAAGSACAPNLNLTGTVGTGNYQASSTITCTNITVAPGADVNIIAPKVVITGTASISQSCKIGGGSCSGTEAPVACFPIEPTVLSMTGNTTAYGVKNGAPSSWVITCSSGCGEHKWADAYADDWAANGGDAATCGWEVYAPFEGTVLNAANCDPGGYGNNVTVRSASNPTYVFRVAHLASMSVTPGQYVTRSTKLGTVGSTGGVGYCHAHVVLYKNIDETQADNFKTKNCHHPGYGESSYYAAPFYFQNCAPAARNAPGANGQPELVIPPAETQTVTPGGFVVTPNPFNSHISIRHKQGLSILSAEIFTANGRKIYSSGNINTPVFEWKPAAAQGAGIYLVKLATGKGSIYTIKVIKQ